MTPQHQQIIQSAIDSEPQIGQAVILDLNAKPIVVLHAVHAPTPPPVPPVPPKPLIKIVTQAGNQWYQEGGTGPINIANICITQGGGLLMNQAVNPSQIVTLTNFYNLAGPTVGGMYAGALLWPPGDDNTQQAIPKLVWDNTAVPDAWVHQGQWEAAFRGKCDDATINGVNFQAWPGGKPVLEIRHGKSWVFNGGTCKDGYMEIGQQSVLGPDGKTSHLVTSQHVGPVVFNNYKFTVWTPIKKCVDRKPGVDKIVYNNCIDPSGQVFSSVE